MRLLNYQKPIPDRQVILISVIFLFLFSVTIFGQTVKNEFVWDAEVVILQEPRISSKDDVFDFFTEPYLPEHNNPTDGVRIERLKYYRPLVGFWHALMVNSFGKSALPFKISNLILNALLSILAYLLVRSITKNQLVSFLSAVLFAANPTKAEIVYWVYSDSHILVAIFSLLTIFSYVHKKQTAVLIFFIAALLSQENAILIPFILISYEYLIRRSKTKDIVIKIWPLLPLMIIYFYIRNLAVGSIPLETPQFPELFNTVSITTLKYFKIFFLTDSLATFYLADHNFLSQIGAKAVGAYIFCLFLIGLSIYLFKMNKALFFWLLWVFFWLSIYTNINSNTEFLMAEKPLYIASLGLCVFIVLSCVRMIKSKRFVIGLVLLITTFHSFDAYSRADAWKDSETYIEELIEFEPNAASLYYHLATEYNETGRYQESIQLYNTLKSLKKQTLQSKGYYRLGMAETYYAIGKNNLAKTDYNEAISNFTKSLNLVPARAKVYFRLGTAYFEVKKYVLAIKSYKKSIRLDPNLVNAYYNLALTYKKAGDLQSAERYLGIYKNVQKKNILPTK
ncbi:MAG: hypothetical protein C0623_11975 [Desulfuromonas sp.]|nr:MAG: hypothetical protein C0623_11975 [Desulfuromonas sp.]